MNFLPSNYWEKFDFLRHRQRADYDNRSSRCFNLLERCIYVIRFRQVVSFRYQAGNACAPNGATCSKRHPAALYRVLWAKWFATGSRRLSKHPACYTGLRCTPSGSGYLCSQWGHVLLEGLCFVLHCSSTQMAYNRLLEPPKQFEPPRFQMDSWIAS